MAIKPILFNTEMVRAILGGRKSQTRRDPFESGHLQNEPSGWRYAGRIFKSFDDFLRYPKSPRCKYAPGDILWVRETYCALPVTPGGNLRMHDVYYYRADGDLRPDGWRERWKPSIHMPKERARIFLRVKNVRLERLQEITVDGMLHEGTPDIDPPPICQKEPHYPESFPRGFDGWDKRKQDDWIESEARARYIGWCKYADDLLRKFANIWNNTIKKADLPRYGWDANPWVWVIEFERCEKPEWWCEND